MVPGLTHAWKLPSQRLTRTTGAMLGAQATGGGCRPCFTCTDSGDSPHDPRQGAPADPPAQENPGPLTQSLSLFEAAGI